ncbi:hypothetical protein GDO78_015962 [Eleutherodactylus coqui]|uniref:Uncharacterized protein n=1 Tax=Eleutherodactylus coqui TaxID=57060 RepID=A0A8J6ED15_ELECQ|nr:hypothetical protein GDO78_015962 [Eleutherodactylus coqui]
METKKEKQDEDVKIGLYRNQSFPKAEPKSTSIKVTDGHSLDAEAVLVPHRPPPKVPSSRPVPYQTTVNSEVNQVQKTEPPATEPPKAVYHDEISDSVLLLRPPPKVPPKPKPEPCANAVGSNISQIAQSDSGGDDLITLDCMDEMTNDHTNHLNKVQTAVPIYPLQFTGASDSITNADVNVTCSQTHLPDCKSEFQPDTTTTSSSPTVSVTPAADNSDIPRIRPVPKPRTLPPSQIVKCQGTKQSNETTAETYATCEEISNNTSFPPAVPPRRKKSAPAAFHLQVLQSMKSLSEDDATSNKNNNNNSSGGTLVNIDCFHETLSTKDNTDQDSTLLLEPQRSWSSEGMLLDVMFHSANPGTSTEQFTSNSNEMFQNQQKSDNSIPKGNCESPW